MNLVEKADQLAERAHRGQTRKESDQPYITHPRAVAAFLTKQGFGETVVAAALVHDVLEDTSVTREELKENLGPEVLSIVESLTTDEDKSLPWEGRKQQYIDWVRAGSADVKAVALADKMHNLQCMLEGEAKQGPDFWKHFTRGRDAQVWYATSLLQMFRESWVHPLVEEYAGLVARFEKVA